MMPHRSRTRTVVIVSVLAVVLVASMAGAVLVGQAGLAPADVWASIAAQFGIGTSPLTPQQDAIIWHLRVPRVLTAAVVGAGLAVAGAVMQALLRNPLADPYLLGLSSGASTGAVIVLVLGATIALPVAAFAGALLALVITLALARAGRGAATTATILAGLAVSAVMSAITSLVIFWSSTPDSYREILNWLLGSVAGATWPDVTLAAIVLVVALVPLLASGRVLDAFALGDTAAAALGVPVARSRLTLLVITALLTAALVAVSGAIGFVGLVLPHAVRFLVGNRNAMVLPIATVAGAIFLLWADTGARILFDPRELPVGIVTALIGGPVFALLMLRRRKERV